MTGDIIQSRVDGWFYRDNGDGTCDNLSAGGVTNVDAVVDAVVLVRNGAATGNGDPLARRVAVVMSRRYDTDVRV